MKSVNKVIMIGNLTADPEVTQVGADLEVAKFTLALNDSYKKPSGEQVEVVTFIDCEAWSGLAKVIKTYLRKGSKVYIEGSLRADKWVDADSGKNRTKHKVKVSDMTMLDGKRDGESSGSYSKPAASEESNEPAVKPASDDELPF